MKDLLFWGLLAVEYSILFYLWLVALQATAQEPADRQAARDRRKGEGLL